MFRYATILRNGKSFVMIANKNRKALAGIKIILMDRIGKVIISAKAKISSQIYTIKTFFEKSLFLNGFIEKKLNII